MTAKKKNRWKDRVMSMEARVLDNSPGLRLKAVTPEDLEALAPCTRIKELEFTSSRGGSIDLEKIAHIEWLECLYLDRVKFDSLAPLVKLPKLHHLVIDHCTIPDLEVLAELKGLVSLVLRDTRIKAFPDGLVLPKLKSLVLNHNPVSDLSFLAGSPEFDSLSLRGTGVTDLSQLSVCPLLEDIDLYGNPVDDLSPLAGFGKLTRTKLDADLGEQAREAGVPGLDSRGPSPEYKARAARLGALRAKIVAGDIEYLSGLEDDSEIGLAIVGVITNQYSASALKGERSALEKVLDSSSPKVFADALARGLGILQQTNIQFVLDLFPRFEDRLPDAMLAAFDQLLAAGRFNGTFEVGLMENAHWNLARLLGKVAAPQYAPVYQRFLDEQGHFSDFALAAYGEMLNSITKTKDASLVPSLIELTTREKLIVNGNASFLKKCFKAIKTLGDASHVDALRATFDVSTEDRADVVKAFEDTIARLEKKKPKQ